MESVCQITYGVGKLKDRFWTIRNCAMVRSGHCARWFGLFEVIVEMIWKNEEVPHSSKRSRRIFSIFRNIWHKFQYGRCTEKKGKNDSLTWIFAKLCHKLLIVIWLKSSVASTKNIKLPDC